MVKNKMKDSTKVGFIIMKGGNVCFTELVRSLESMESKEK